MTTRVVGVTGPSSGITEEHRGRLRDLLAGATLVRHGVCRGADEAADQIARALGIPRHGHPGVDKNGLSPKRFRPLDIIGVYTESPPEPYLDRNATIVAAIDELVALVRRETYYRSGEWATIRRARNRGIPVTLVLPDGTLRQIEVGRCPPGCAKCAAEYLDAKEDG